MPDSTSKPRILITRLSAIGDCVHTLPLVAALRERYPHAFIAWATQGAGASVLRGAEGLDEIIVVDRRWMNRWSSISKLRKQLRGFEFDVTVDPQSLTKSAMIAWLTGAPKRIGFTAGQARELAPWLNNTLVQPKHDHVVQRYLELLGPLGIEQPRPVFRLPHDEQASASMMRFAAARILDKTAIASHNVPRFALLNVGAGWNSKRWPHARYAEVAKYLSNSHGLPSIVLWAGDEERAMAAEVVASSAGTALMAPPTSLRELTELCRLAEIFVGSDTGPLHIAAAVDTPCVSMYGPTKPSICGPFGAGHIALQQWYQGGNSKQRRSDDNSAMRAIPVEHVCDGCDQIVAGQERGRVA